MSESKQASGPEIPLEALRTFEATGVPLSVVSELFDRAELPVEIQERFWQVAREKQFSCISGKVGNIKTKRDGSVVVAIASTATGGAPSAGQATPLTNFFYRPPDITEAQLAELKRAQSAKLCVRICFQSEQGGRPIDSVEVFECP